MSAHNQQLGRFGENAAALWYLNGGYEVVDRNWRVREGELDLVCIRRPRSTMPPGLRASTDRTPRTSKPVGGESTDSDGCTPIDRASSDWAPDDWATGAWVPDDWATGDPVSDDLATGDWASGDWAAGSGHHDSDDDEDGSESDLQARSLVVFVEVKTRTSDRFGGGYLAVDRRKQAKLRQLATIWLGSSGTYFDEVRFDVVDVNAKGHLQVWEAAF